MLPWTLLRVIPLNRSRNEPWKQPGMDQRTLQKYNLKIKVYSVL